MYYTVYIDIIVCCVYVHWLRAIQTLHELPLILAKVHKKPSVAVIIVETATAAAATATFGQIKHPKHTSNIPYLFINLIRTIVPTKLYQNAIWCWYMYVESCCVAAAVARHCHRWSMLCPLFNMIQLSVLGASGWAMDVQR